MDGLVLLAKGAAVGFAIAAPVGPVGLLCVRRTLLHGRLAGLLSGAGAATADAIYGCIAAFGLTLISDWLLQHATAFRLLGGLFLLFLAWRMLRPHAPTQVPEDKPGGRLNLPQAFASTFILTLTNPITIAAFLGIFAGIGLHELSKQRILALALVAGVFLGSALWWVILASGAGAFRGRFGDAGERWISRVSGSIMLAFGAYALGGLLWIA